VQYPSTVETIVTVVGTQEPDEVGVDFQGVEVDLCVEEDDFHGVVVGL
jgi:hypothetical protein